MNFLFYNRHSVYVVIHWRMKLVFHGGLRQIHTHEWAPSPLKDNDRRGGVVIVPFTLS